MDTVTVDIAAAVAMKALVGMDEGTVEDGSLP